MTKPVVLVTYAPDDEGRRVYLDTLGDLAEIHFWPEEAERNRSELLRRTHAVLSFNFAEDLGLSALSELEACRLVQCMTAGVDFLPLGALPAEVTVACNAGAYAEAMAEHVLAMALAAAKRLPGEHTCMKAGEFNQFRQTRRFAGLTCGILGYGGAGREVARLMRTLGLEIRAINRSGRTTDPVAFIGTLTDTDEILAHCDILVVTLALTRKTRALIGAERLGLMKRDAILVNVARGEIIEQHALYEHLIANPDFTACLEAWWVEPIRHGRFELDYPFLDLPNVIASPHNSAMAEGMIDNVLRRGARNVRRFLLGEAPRFIVGDDEILN